jgi:hypothetical protein
LSAQVFQAIELVAAAAVAVALLAPVVAAPARVGAVNPIPAAITAVAITAVIFRINDPVTSWIPFHNRNGHG